MRLHQLIGQSCLAQTGKLHLHPGVAVQHELLLRFRALQDDVVQWRGHEMRETGSTVEVA